MKRNTALLATVIGSALAGCGDNLTVQTVSGRVSPSGFPAPITGVQVVKAGVVVTRRVLDHQGAFSLWVPPGRHYQLQLVAAGGAQAALVFPRHGTLAATIARTFTVTHPGMDIDVGTLQYVGDPTKVTFAFKTAGACTGDGECVDDDGTNQHADNQDGQQGEDQQGDNQDNQCGADEADDNSDQAAGDGNLDMDAAVGDNNIADDIGCNDGANAGGDNATGAMGDATAL